MEIFSKILEWNSLNKSEIEKNVQYKIIDLVIYEILLIYVYFLLFDWIIRIL